MPITPPKIKNYQKWRSSLLRLVFGVCWPTWPLTRTRGTNKSKTIRLWCRLDITFSPINPGETYHFHSCRGSLQFLVEEDFSISFVLFFPFPPPIWSLATGICQSDKKKEIESKLEVKHDSYVWIPSLPCTKPLVQDVSWAKLLTWGPTQAILETQT